MMKWVGSGPLAERALALVYYDPVEEIWHIGDSQATREFVENVPDVLARLEIGRLLRGEIPNLIRAITEDSALKSVERGW